MNRTHNAGAHTRRRGAHPRRRSARSPASFQGQRSADRGEISRRGAGVRRAARHGSFGLCQLGARQLPGALEDPGGGAVEARRLCFKLPRHPVGEVKAVLSAGALGHLSPFCLELSRRSPHPARSNDRTKRGLAAGTRRSKAPTALAAPDALLATGSAVPDQGDAHFTKEMMLCLPRHAEAKGSARPNLHFVKSDRSTESAIF